MKANRLRWFLLFLLGSAVLQVPAQQSEADRRLLADIRAKAEKGDAQYQYLLATAFFSGDLGLPRDEAQAVKWFRRAAEHKLVDEHGNVVGVVAAKLNVAGAVATSGALPENVNYAVKSSLLLSFLESVPDLSAKLKEPNANERKFEDVVKSAENAAVLVLVY